jgi:predicted transglutaminase-like cysteine proteinase
MASFEPIGAEVKSPSGWQQFCRDWPAECPNDDRQPRDIVLTSEVFDKIAAVNLSINREIKPLTDKEQYGRTEYWTYPNNGQGDCEDYLLLKRRTLMEQGFPRQALLITVVALPNGDGHAVLTVRTDHGEYVLDNLRDQILPWAATGYRFVKRQSQRNPNVWVTLGNESQKAVAAAK